MTHDHVGSAGLPLAAIHREVCLTKASRKGLGDETNHHNLAMVIGAAALTSVALAVTGDRWMWQGDTSPPSDGKLTYNGMMVTAYSGPALDAVTGALLWSTSDSVVSAPVVANGFVYATTNDGRLVSYSLGPPTDAPRLDPATLRPNATLPAGGSP